MLIHLAIVVLLVLSAAVVAVLVLRIIYRLPQWTPPLHVTVRPQPHRNLVTTNGIHILDDGVEAFAARHVLLQRAERLADLQYYMWHGDLTGYLLLAECVAAADRGVMVRLLIDDNTTAGDDVWMAAAAQHPNIQVRLFNPFTMRKPRLPNYLFDFRRINRRMHNKSMTIDGVWTVVGGRNLGDEYFSAHANTHFADMDVLVKGPVVQDVAHSFQAYWESASSFASEHVLPPVEPNALDHLRRDLAAHVQTKAAQDYMAEASKARIGKDIYQDVVKFDEVPVSLAVDDPAKGLGEIPRRSLLLDSFEKNLGSIEKSLDVATAYFVPGRFGSGFLCDAASSGKSVRILTNSLASNDVVPVHAGYARYRKKLLRHGVGLFELRAGRLATESEPGRRRRRLPRFGASSSSLHAKVFVLDRRRVFIGSFNLDPRSLYLNCEMGLMIDSPRLAERIARQMDHLIAERSYHPFITFGNRLSWGDAEGNQYRVEPESTVRQRAFAWLISWLPVEWLL